MARSKGWSVFYRKNRERYYLAYFGRQKVLPPSIANKRQAERWARAFLAEQGLVDGAEEVTPETIAVQQATVDSLGPKWIEFRRKYPEKWEPSTIEGNESHVRNHLIPAFTGRPLHMIGDAEQCRWLRQLRQERAANTTRNIYRTWVAFLDHVQRAQWAPLKTNPARSVAVAAEVPPAENLINADVELVIPIDHARLVINSESIPLERRAQHAVAAGTGGQRAGEVFGLKWEDIDFGRRVLRVRQAAKIRGPKGWASLGSTKNRTSVRTVPLHPVTARLLADWWAGGWVVKVGRNPEPGDLVFPGAKGQPVRPRVAELLRADLESLGLPSHVEGHPIQFHSWRSSFVCWLVDLGVEEIVIRRLIGHAQTGATGRSYLRGMNVLRSAVEQLELGTSDDPCAGHSGGSNGAGTEGVEVPENTANVRDDASLAQLVEQRFRKPLPPERHAATESVSPRIVRVRRVPLNGSSATGGDSSAQDGAATCADLELLERHATRHGIGPLRRLVANQRAGELLSRLRAEAEMEEAIADLRDAEAEER